ncbi:MAG: hypothetical protein SCALA701_06990 [Candidatus Scalindua sp.]|nr:hypothetical protein [Planctomycetota bacterium]RZV95245.1 MAG: hypothetical protein EX341_02625 [Candidatus Scalindua sp. SCAELEC01]GJQ57898.1 MAG: hypothetical protein SCALA701_06990 [Candidatus Scalindua sp.]
MNKKYCFFTRVLIVVVISLTVYGRLSFSQEESFHYFKIKLNVEAEPENIKGSIENYMERELRDLGDVILTDSESEWEINVKAAEIITENSDKKDIVCTAVVFEPVNKKKLDALIDTYLYKRREIGNSAIEKFSTELAKLMYEYKRLSEHLFFLTDSIHIRRLCSEIIADFNGKCLNPKREFYQREQEAIRKLY